MIKALQRLRQRWHDRFGHSWGVPIVVYLQDDLHLQVSIPCGCGLVYMHDMCDQLYAIRRFFLNQPQRFTLVDASGVFPEDHEFPNLLRC